MAEDVTDYGAVGDGTTNDTQAINDAADAAGPGGTVYFPSGTYLIGANTRFPIEYPMDGSWDNLTWKGEDHSDTTILMDQQDGFYWLFYINSDGGYQIPDVWFEQLTLDGQQSVQPDTIGGHIIHVQDGDGTLHMTDCVIQNPLNAGVILEDAMGGDFSYCDFINCGDPAASAGHAINPLQTTDTWTYVDHCFIDDSAGTDIDIGHSSGGSYQRVQITNTYVSEGRGAMKLEGENIETTWQNCHIEAGPRTTIGIKTNTDTADTGDLTLDNVYITGGSWDAVDLAADAFGTLTLNQVAIEDVDNNDNRNAGMYLVDGNVDGGTISIHDVSSNNNGDGFYASGCTGSIDEVIYGGTSSPGNWPTDGVSINTTTAGSPLNPDTPTQSEVGPRAPGSSTSTGFSVGSTTTTGTLHTTGGTVATYTDVVRSTVIDSFEDGDISEYSVSNTNTSVVNDSNLSFSAQDGTYVLEHPAGGNNSSLTSTSGLANYFSKGQIAHAHVRFGSLDGDAWVRFGLADRDNNYYVEVSPNFNNFRVLEDNSGSVTELAADTSVSYSTGQWYDVQITWDDGTLGGNDNDISATLFDNNSNTISAIGPGNSSTFATNTGIGWFFRNNTNGAIWVDNYNTE